MILLTKTHNIGCRLTQAQEINIFLEKTPPPKSIENRHHTCFRKVAGIVFWSRILSVFHCSFLKSLWCEITKCCWSMPSANPSRLYWLDLLCWNVCGLQWICAPFFPIMKKTCQIFFSARFIPCSLILFFTEQIKTSGFLVWISPEILLKTRVTLATFQFPELSSLAPTAQKFNPRDTLEHRHLAWTIFYLFILHPFY